MTEGKKEGLTKRGMREQGYGTGTEGALGR